MRNQLLYALFGPSDAFAQRSQAAAGAAALVESHGWQLPQLARREGGLWLLSAAAIDSLRHNAAGEEDTDFVVGNVFSKLRASTQRRGRASSAGEAYDSIKVRKKLPYLQLKTPSDVDPTIRVFDELLTSRYLGCLHEIATRGVSFAGQAALVTGASRWLHKRVRH